MSSQDSSFKKINYGDYQLSIYNGGLNNKIPSISTDSRNWVVDAQAILPASSWGYLNGGAGAAATMDANTTSFKKWHIKPRMLKGNNKRDLSVELFGKKYETPIIMAPVGVNKIFHPDGESGVARACARLNVPYTLSTASTTPTEDVAVANGSGNRWFQLYWPMNKDNEITASMLSRAQNSGYEVLLVTLDLFALGWRPTDLDHGYDPFYHGIGEAIGFSDPVFKAKYKKQTGQEVSEDSRDAAMNWSETVFSGVAHKWEDLKFLKEHWKGPIVLKGIQTVEDALLAVEAGVDGIVVSNHGGRQYDGAAGSLDVLPEIAEAVGERLTILFDSGIRTGADIMKAMALGAKAVLIGRPIIYGLAIRGEEGAEHVMKCLLNDLDMNLGITGYTSPTELNIKSLRKV